MPIAAALDILRGGLGTQWEPKSDTDWPAHNFRKSRLRPSPVSNANLTIG